MRIDPRNLIRAPFVTCPKCKKLEYGIATINGDFFTRKCKNCYFLETHDLPQIHKKLIYFDQFVISNIAKSLKQNEPNRKANFDPDYWLKIYRLLIRGRDAQILVCPSSVIHSDESIVSKINDELKIIYEELGYNSQFKDSIIIEKVQIISAFRQYLGIDSNLTITFDVTQDNPHYWHDGIYVSMRSKQSHEYLDELRNIRDKGSNGLNKIFCRWQCEKNRSFDDWYSEELLAEGKCIIDSSFQHIKIIESIRQGKLQPTFDLFLPNHNLQIFKELLSLAEKQALNEEEIWQKIASFLSSKEQLSEVPYINIQAMLFASLAKSAALGRKRPPSAGMTRDVKAISAYLPYVDAMFIDNECREFLSQLRNKSLLNYSTHIFSQSNKENFVEWLEDLIRTIPTEHQEILNRIYGPPGPEPPNPFI